MTFSIPLGLLGLLSLPVILALHLFRERQRRMPVSSLELWAFLKPEVHGSRPRRIPITWLLLLDLLAALLFSLVLAQPVLNLSLPAQKNRQLVLILDVSTSMNASDILPSRMSQARLEANRLLSGLEPGDTATLISFSAGAQVISDTRLGGYQHLVEALAALQAGDTGHTLDQALVLGTASLDGKLPAEFHILTDGAYPEPQLGGFDYPITWHIYGEQSGNQAVLGISAAETAGGKIDVFARLANFSGKTVTRVVSLLVDDRLVTSTTLQIPAGAVVPQVWQLNPGPASATVMLTAGDVLSSDDSATTGLMVGSRAHVILVTEQPYPLQQAISAAPGADLQVLAPTDYLPAALVDLTVLRGTVPAVWPENTVLLVEPIAAPADSPAQAWVTQAKNAIPANAPVHIKDGEPLLAGLDFNGVRWGEVWKPTAVPPGFETLISTNDTQGQVVPLLLRGYAGSTRLLVLLADLKSGNFTRHPAFPLLINNVIESIQRAPLPAVLSTGQAIILPPAGEFHTLQLIPPGSTSSSDLISLFSGNWPEIWTQTFQPGAYRLELVDFSGRQMTQVVGVNAGDETESNLAPRSWISAQVNRSAVGSAAPGQPLNLAPWLMGLAGLVLFLEAWLAWH